MTTKIKIENGNSKEILHSEYLHAMVGKNIVYLGGCFCPPHKGHYNMIKNSILSGSEITGGNIHVALINFATSFEVDKYKSRHGIPYTLSLSMMITYLQKLSIELNIIFYLQKDKDFYFGTEIPMKLDGTIVINKKVNVFTFENVDEETKEEEVEKYKQNMYDVRTFAFGFPREQIRNSIMDNKAYVEKQLLEKMILLVVDRDMSGPSATKFTTFLRKAIPFDKIPKDTLDFFFPETITHDERRVIVNTIQENYYNKEIFTQCLKDAEEQKSIRIKQSCIKFYPKVDEFIQIHFPEFKNSKVKKLDDEQIEKVINKIIEEGYED